VSDKKYPFWPLFLSLLTLCCLSLLILSSVAPQLLGKQISYWLVGLFILFLTQRIKTKVLVESPYPLFFVSCFLLFLPLIFNLSTRGTLRWINIGTFTLQPTEFVKPLLALFVIIVLQKEEKVKTIKTYLQLSLLLLPLILTMLQPNLGTTLVIAFNSLCLLLVSRVSLKPLLPLFLVFALLIPFLFRFVLHDYQKDRLTYFLSPQKDPLGQGYQLTQSQIAIGSGGLTGEGYKKGTQNQLFFLPEKQNDFIFAALAEELGFVGVSILLLAFLLLFLSLLKIALAQTGPTKQLFTFYLLFQLWFHTITNIGMNLGVMPVTGLPLPFVSSGGSHLLANLLSLAFIFSDLSLDS
jgi:cell division protein FtsW (lipid II flippase)